MKSKILMTALAIALLSWPKTAAADTCSTLGGRATVVQANGLGIVPVVLSDTGNLDSTGDAKQASLSNASVAGLISGEVLHATAISGGTSSQSEASLANLVLTVAGNTIGADFLMARANAECGSVGPTVSGITEIDGLVVNGQSIPVTGSPNQTVALPGGGLMILNEQTTTVPGSISVNTLHVTLPGVTDVVIASPSAVVSPFLSIGPPPTPQCDFVTGGGWITTPMGAKGTFGVGGGIKNGALWGHLEYQDHGTGMNVHGTSVTDYVIIDMNSREIKGTARVNGVDGFTYIVDVTDNGEPGRMDMFAIKVFGLDPMTPVYVAGPATLGGGNIQLHTKCC